MHVACFEVSRKKNHVPSSSPFLTVTHDWFPAPAEKSKLSRVLGSGTCQIFWNWRKSMVRVSWCPKLKRRMLLVYEGSKTFFFVFSFLFLFSFFSFGLKKWTRDPAMDRSGQWRRRTSSLHRTTSTCNFGSLDLSSASGSASSFFSSGARERRFFLQRWHCMAWRSGASSSRSSSDEALATCMEYGCEARTAEIHFFGVLRMRMRPTLRCNWSPVVLQWLICSRECLPKTRLEISRTQKNEWFQQI